MPGIGLSWGETCDKGVARGEGEVANFGRFAGMGLSKPFCSPSDGSFCSSCDAKESILSDEGGEESGGVESLDDILTGGLGEQTGYMCCVSFEQLYVVYVVL
jgi:hypothetical protein